jgi:hypothetical protein
MVSNQIKQAYERCARATQEAENAGAAYLAAINATTDEIAAAEAELVESAGDFEPYISRGDVADTVLDSRGVRLTDRLRWLLTAAK